MGVELNSKEETEFKIDNNPNDEESELEEDNDEYSPVQIVVVVSNINNSFTWYSTFLQNNATSPLEQMFLIQHFGSFGSNQFYHARTLHKKVLKTSFIIQGGDKFIPTRP